MMSSIRLPSQSRLEYWGPRRSDYIIPIRLETAFSQPNLQTQTDRALREVAKITESSTVLSKLCISVEWLAFGGRGFIASINQSIHSDIKIISTNVQAVSALGKICLKAGYMLFKLCQRNDKCAPSVWVTIKVILKFYI